MKDKLISDKLSDNQMLNDLQRLLDEELSKPLEERDLDAIEEITNAVISINDEEVPKPVSAEKVLGEVSARKKRGRIIQLRKWAAALTACIAVCIAANLYTINTYGANIVETVMKIAKSGFSVDLNELRDFEAADPVTTTIPPTATLATSASGTQSDIRTYTTTRAMETWAAGGGTYGITTVPTAAVTTETNTVPAPAGPSGTGSTHGITDRCDEYSREVARELIEKCEEHDIYPCYPEKLPYYLGDLTLDDYHFEQMKDSKDMYFTFTDDNDNSLDIIIEEYVSADRMPDVLIPSDEYEYDTFKNDYMSGVVIDEGNGTTIVFVRDNTVYTLHGNGMYKEAWVEAAMGFVPYPSEFLKK
ncbi:MAG: DUF4367 domain-containing protein [Ruminococcus sp.]|uniref:DUF4367 domain-containing protein n=1 Tax=Ruminococcus sp. TaxID=41978 RepID=UPI0025E4BD4F|nr:DUF4367 domain-containing protein [Ruminococcus sp.]MCR4794508.1 DUF4367 domain-containing protein [Ruminococcus sp.]